MENQTSIEDKDNCSSQETNHANDAWCCKHASVLRVILWNWNAEKSMPINFLLPSNWEAVGEKISFLESFKSLSKLCISSTCNNYSVQSKWTLLTVSSYWLLYCRISTTTSVKRRHCVQGKFMTSVYKESSSTGFSFTAAIQRLSGCVVRIHASAPDEGSTLTSNKPLRHNLMCSYH